jgi:aminoglycoside phosphotransferase
LNLLKRPALNYIHHSMAKIQTLEDYDNQHEGSEHLAINNTYMHRLIALLALHTMGKFFNPYGACIPISKRKIIKTSFRVHLTEAATIKYVSEHTTIPVPKVYCAFVHDKRAYIVMERIQGRMLASAWKNLSREARKRILLQLKSMIEQLRTLEPPPGVGVQSCVGGSLYDSRLRYPHDGSPRFGPFETIQEFHSWLREDLSARQLEGSKHVTKEEAKDIKAMIRKQDSPWPPPVFTHCDLNPGNILVHGEKIVGVIDWESSGWYPSYWEYTCAWLGNITRTDWQATLTSVLDQYPEELEMERTRNKWWGEY